MTGQVLVVVGGVASGGGILVREDKDVSSQQFSERLSTGALIKGVSHEDDRLKYEKLQGAGPHIGWVNTTWKGRPLVTDASNVWTVVGGGTSGGILVRKGMDTTSEAFEDRLSTGALIHQLALSGDRMGYERVSGSGPQNGWISTKFKGADLVVRMDKTVDVTAAVGKAEKLPARPATVTTSVPQSPASDAVAPHAWRTLGQREFRPVRGRKMRVLVVHGTPANSNIMKFQTMQLKQALGKNAEFIYIDGPIPWEPIPGGQFDHTKPRSEMELRLAQGQAFKQWYGVKSYGLMTESGGTDEWTQVKECCDHLKRCILMEEPIDVVVAFSQGASTVGLLIETLRRDQEKVPWRLNVFFSGANVDDETHKFRDVSPIPTIMVSGAKSDQYSWHTMNVVKTMYSNLCVLEHGDGHAFPTTKPRAGEIYAQIAADMNYLCGFLDVPAENLKTLPNLETSSVVAQRNNMAASGMAALASQTPALAAERRAISNAVARPARSSTAREEGVSWPADDSNDLVKIDFYRIVCEALNTRRYCKISVPSLGAERESVVSDARQIAYFGLPPLEFEEGMLGQKSRSKAGFFSPSAMSEASPSLNGCFRMMEDLSYAFGYLDENLGFRAFPGLQRLMMREPVERGERTKLSPGPLTEEQVERGEVAELLNFMQLRRICIMYILDTSSGTLELHPNHGGKTIRVPLVKDTIVAFRHDEMSYTYQGARTGPDVALQGWVMAQQDQLALSKISGDHQGLEKVYGGPRLQGNAQPAGDQIHIMSLANRQPAGAYGMGAQFAMFRSNTDTFKVVPSTRWDVDVYYSPNAVEDGGGVKGHSRHAGFVHDEEMSCFDNELFGIEDSRAACIPPGIRQCMEILYETLQARGYTLDTVRGRNIALYLADCGDDWNPFFGLAENPEAWRDGRDFAMPHASRISYELGLKGASQSIDTACSSSLVASVLLYNNMRRRPDPTMQEGLVGSYNFCLSAAPFVGMSLAGMLGRTGRAMTFDNSANGFARGEGILAACWKVGGDAQDVQDREAAFVCGFINQDGRSASLTAPNGPSQQLCIQACFRLSGILPGDIHCNENHGTGTALGDPIEVGSARAIFWKNRQEPIAITSGKSHHGHPECSAGLSGSLKTINSLRHSCVPPQCHLKNLNAHIEDHGFPGIFPMEAYPLNVAREGMMCGLNSFGFGGTNSHGEIWATSKNEARKSEQAAIGNLVNDEVPKIQSFVLSCTQCGGTMCFLCGVAFPNEPGSSRQHKCSDIRQQVDSYHSCSRCYKGKYLFRGEESYALEMLTN